ncbi:MAG: hypothetical protein IPH05_16020 [Flavobacteriales bacterium]|jgi:hypothetical protein|nr:hypothetical protein [Flavobacteriales bacterium]MBK6884414.1 hypothetical protein [Flavobacteriales bacterium]MBK7100811.1 hypothetical protein [Flavobacteriales bacterium]MBK7111498.1 hypothetical protein [Flavobacteriales bacterium]MBK7484146.1 hypothetical protein [Flavobacteriales bacterium]
MKKLFTLLAFIGIMGAANAQSTATDAPKKEDAKVEKTHNCAGHGDAKADGKACCAGKKGAKAEANADGKTPACCAKMAKDGKACDHAKAEAGDGHGEGHGHLEGDGHDHGAMKAHVCTDACKEGAHAFACGEEGHVCSGACHAKK